MILFLYQNVHTYIYNYSFDILFVHCVVEMCQRVFPREVERIEGRGGKGTLHVRTYDANIEKF